MSFPECNILLVKCVDSVHHLLHQLHLAVSQPLLVGDVVGNTSLSTRLSSGSTWLKVKLFTSGSKNLGAKLGPSWEVDVNRSSHACSKVRWAGVDVSVSFVQQEMIINQLLSDLLTHSSEREVRSGEVSFEVCKCLLHQVLNINSLLLGDSG